MAPGLPNYECLAYQEQAPLWAYLDDVFQGSEAWLKRTPEGDVEPTPKAQTYLPKEAAEESGDWLNRLKRSPFDDRFQQSIRKFCNLILANGLLLDSIPDRMLPDLKNIDGQGTSLQQFIYDQGIQTLKHGHSFILVDYPPADETIRSQQDFINSGRRPYWISYKAPDVLHWLTESVAGQIRLIQVTLRETRRIGNGAFSESEETVYRVLRPGSWELWAIDKDQQGKESSRFIDDGTTSLDYIPLVPVYGGLRSGYFTSRPPLKSLADLNVNHYQVKSDHLRKIHLCCLPVPVLKDSLRPENEPLKLGPNSFIHVRDPAGSFFWAEPLATSIIESRNEVNDLEATMDILSAAYLRNPASRQAATTTNAQSAEVESSLQAFADELAQGITNALMFHAAYLGLLGGGTLKLSGDVVKDKGNDSQMLMAITGLAKDDVISKETLLEELQRREFLTAEVDIQQELSRVGKQIQLIAVGALDTAPTPDSGSPPIDPAVVVEAYVNLAKAGLIKADRVVEVINKFSVPLNPSPQNGHTKGVS